MKGRRPTYRELEATIVSFTDRISTLENNQKAANRTIEEQGRLIKEKDRIIEEQGRRLRYYENENSPPSAESLEYKRQKAQRKRERASNRGNGSNSGTGKKPGGQRGHKGTSRRHDPQKTVLHTFQDNDGTCSPVCMCGRAMDITALIRNIIGPI